MTKKKKIILSCFLVAVLLVTGTVSGFFIGNLIAFRVGKKVDYGFDVKAYTETISDIKYLNSDTPSNRSASDAFIIATHVLNQKKYYNIKGDGLVNTGLGKIGSLKLWGSAEKENGQIHTSIIAWNKLIGKYQVGLKYDYDIQNDSIDFYYGKSKSDGSAVWKNPTNISSSDYVSEWGLEPTNFFTYTISSKTALNNSYATPVFENGQKLYSYSLSLDPVYSVANYATQLKKMSGLDNYPVFSFCYFNFVVDESFSLKEVTIHEKYSVYMYGVNVTCDANIKYDFIY